MQVKKLALALDLSQYLPKFAALVQEQCQSHSLHPPLAVSCIHRGSELSSSLIWALAIATAFTWFQGVSAATVFPITSSSLTKYGCEEEGSKWNSWALELC